MMMGYKIGLSVRPSTPIIVQYKLDFSSTHNTGYYSIFF